MAKPLFTLQKQNRIILTSNSQNNVILTSFNHEKLFQVLKIIETNHQKSNKLLLHTAMSTNSKIYFTERDIREPFDNFGLAYFDLKDHNHMKYIANLYYIHKLKFFIIDDFVFNEQIPLLTLQGMTVQHGPPVSTDIEVYLKNIDTLYYLKN